MSGDTIRRVDKTAKELDFTLDEYIPSGQVVYDRKNPNDYLSMDDFKMLTKYNPPIIYRLIEVSFYTIFCFVGLGILMIVLKKKAVIDMDYLCWSS